MTFRHKGKPQLNRTFECPTDGLINVRRKQNESYASSINAILAGLCGPLGHQVGKDIESQFAAHKECAGMKIQSAADQQAKREFDATAHNESRSYLVGQVQLGNLVSSVCMHTR